MSADGSSGAILFGISLAEWRRMGSSPVERVTHAKPSQLLKFTLGHLLTM